jgi:hypothetical protein
MLRSCVFLHTCHISITTGFSYALLLIQSSILLTRISDDVIFTWFIPFIIVPSKTFVWISQVGSATYENKFVQSEESNGNDKIRDLWEWRLLAVVNTLIPNLAPKFRVVLPFLSEYFEWEPCLNIFLYSEEWRLLGCCIMWLFEKNNVLYECIATIIRVTRIGELGITLVVVSNRRTLRRNAMWHGKS